VRRNLTRRINKLLPFDRRSYITEEFLRCDPRVLRLRARGRVYMEGYWQSEEYFKDISDVIRKDFEMKPSFDEVTLSEAEKIAGKNSVCVGIRRYREGPIPVKHAVLGPEYYLKAIDLMAQKLPDAHFFVVSEEPEWVMENLKIPYPATFISHKPGDENAYKNLWLMSLCKHFVVSQGTYHWWGAWLGKDPDKIVIAPDPDKWAFNKDFFPKEWITIDA